MRRRLLKAVWGSRASGSSRDKPRAGIQHRRLVCELLESRRLLSLTGTEQQVGQETQGLDEWWTSLGPEVEPQAVVPECSLPRLTQSADTIVPVRKSVGNYRTDLYYADLQGTWDADKNGIYGESGGDGADLRPEVWVGRITVRTAKQTTDYINKLVRYETASPDDYANSMLLVGRTLSSHYNTGTARGAGFIDHEYVSGGEVYVVSLFAATGAGFRRRIPVANSQTFSRMRQNTTVK
jgi:hypothetical protein